jgi:amino acid adenylation domain-containing protein
VAGWLEMYRVLVAGWARQPETPLAALPLVDDAERTRLAAGGGTTRAFPATLVHAYVERWAAERPGDVAVVGTSGPLTWQALNGAANQLAREFEARGVTRGGVVALCLERCTEMVVSLLAAFKVGAAYVPLDPAAPAERLQWTMDDAGASVVVTDGAHEGRLPAGGPPRLLLDGDRDRERVAQQPAGDLARPVAPDDLAYVIYTSGSTGTPKGVAVEHRQLTNYAHALLERLALERPASFAMVSTVAADLGHTALFPALVSGGVLHVVAPTVATSGHALADYFTEHGIDVLKITPSHLATLRREHPEANLLPRRCLVLGGEASPRGWVAELRALAPHCDVFNHYGPTETTVGALMHHVDGDPLDGPGDTLPIGTPLANLRAYVLDPHGMPVPDLVPGELWIGGAGVARGYLRRPELTAERFLPDRFAAVDGARMYRTGDRVRRLADGTIQFLGRLDTQVKVRGFRVELGEVAAALRAQPGVGEAEVVLREDAPGDQRLVAYVTPAAPDAAPVPSALRTALRRTLPDYMVPSAIVALAALPLTPNGKVDRRALPSPDQDRPELAACYVAPRTDTEARVAAILAEVLGVSRVGVHDDFFELGGHSLLAARAAMRIRAALGADVTLSTFFEAPTVARMAARVQPAAGAVPAGAATVIPRATRTPVRRDSLQGTADVARA